MNVLLTEAMTFINVFDKASLHRYQIVIKGLDIYANPYLDIYIYHLNAFRLFVRPFGTNGVKIWQTETVKEAVAVLQLLFNWFSTLKI